MCALPAFAETQNSAWETANAAGLQAYRQGRYSDAKQWFMQALTEAERSGEPNPSQAMTLNNLAAVHEALGETREAELRYRQSLSMIEAIQGPNHPDLVPGLKNLALLYVKDGKLQQAEPLLKRSLNILETHLGTDSCASHPKFNNSRPARSIPRPFGGSRTILFTSTQHCRFQIYNLITRKLPLFFFATPPFSGN